MKRRAISAQGIIITQNWKKDADIHIYDSKKEKIIAKIDTNQDTARCLFNNNGNIFLSKEYIYGVGAYLRLLDTKSGEVVDYLRIINEKITDEASIKTYSLGENAKYIAAVINDMLYVYDVHNKKIVYEQKSNKLYDIEVFMDEAKHSVIIIDSFSGEFTKINIDNGENTDLGYIDYYGNNFTIRHFNPYTNRMFVQEFVSKNSNSVGCIYSVSKTKKLFDMVKINQCYDTYWAIDRKCDLAISSDGEMKNATIWQIPAFDDIVEETRKISRNRKLTQQERQNSGLDMFD